MKLTSAIAGLALLLFAGCQVPLAFNNDAKQGALITRAGTASVQVTVATNGLKFVPTGTANSNGRFVIPPSNQVGSYVLSLRNSSNGDPDIVGNADTGLTNVPPGIWDLTVDLKNTAGSALLGTTTLNDVSIVSGPNVFNNVAIEATQGGTGDIDVVFSWPSTPGVTSVEFNLYRLTLNLGPPITISKVLQDTQSYTGSLASATYAKSGMNSGTYSLVMQLKNGSYSHPPVTATLTVYDNHVTNNGDTTVVLAASQLSGPPAMIASLQITGQNGRPRLTWPSAPSTATGYNIYRDAVLLTSTTAGATSYEDADNHGFGALFHYSVTPYNNFGEGSATAGDTYFQGVSSVAVSGPSRVIVGGTQVFTPAITPNDATFQSVGWSSDAPATARVVPGGTVRALGVGTINLKATSDELAALSWNGSTFDDVRQSAQQPVSVEADVSNIGGNGANQGYIDGAQGISTFTMPTAVATGSFSGQELVYIFDVQAGQGVVREMDPSTTITTTITNLSTPIPGPVVAATADTNGYVFFIVGNGIYRYYTNDHTMIPWAGDYSAPDDNVTGSGTNARFASPRGITLANGYLYVADTGNHLIKKVATADGATTNYAADGSNSNYDGPQINAGVASPTGIVFDGVDNLYVTSVIGGSSAAGHGNVIRKLSMSGASWTTIAGTNGVPGSNDGPALDPDGAGPSTGGLFFDPQGLAIDGNSLYVADGNMVRRVVLPGPGNPTAQITTLVGQFGSPGVQNGLGLDARLGVVKSIATLGGRVFIADPEQYMIRHALTSVYESIFYDNIQFSASTYFDFNSYELRTGNGVTGNIAVGTILLYQTSTGNPGKLLITGIDENVGAAGAWAIHFDWTTWTPGGSIVSRGTNGYYATSLGPNMALDLDTGNVAALDANGDLELTGYTDADRRLNAASSYVTVRIFQ